MDPLCTQNPTEGLPLRKAVLSRLYTIGSLIMIFKKNIPTLVRSMADKELVPKKMGTQRQQRGSGSALHSQLFSKRSKVCRATVGTSTGNTTNPFNHLKRKHQKEVGTCCFTQAGTTSLICNSQHPKTLKVKSSK